MLPIAASRIEGVSIPPGLVEVREFACSLLRRTFCSYSHIPLLLPSQLHGSQRIATLPVSSKFASLLAHSSSFSDFFFCFAPRRRIRTYLILLHTPPEERALVMRHTPISTQQAKDKPTLEGLTHRTGLTHRIEGLHSHHVTHVPNAAHKQGKSPMEHALTRSLCPLPDHRTPFTPRSLPTRKEARTPDTFPLSRGGRPPMHLVARPGHANVLRRTAVNPRPPPVRVPRPTHAPSQPRVPYLRSSNFDGPPRLPTVRVSRLGVP